MTHDSQLGGVPDQAREVTPAFHYTTTPIRSGQVLIEASAGTGKTFALTGLVVRLVLDEVDLKEILVVTFTNAATDELKTRIRSRLRAALHVFENPDREDRDGFRDVARSGQAESRSPEELLRKALLEVDEASVFTIHGFCQRVLQQAAFESGEPFEAEFVEEADELFDRAVADVISKRTHDDPWAAWIAARLGEKAIRSRYKDFFRYPGVRFEPQVPAFEEAKRSLKRQINEFIPIWDSRRDSISEALTGLKLNQPSRLKSEEDRWEVRSRIDTHLSTEPFSCAEAIEALSAGHIKENLRKNSPEEHHAAVDSEALFVSCEALAGALSNLDRSLIHTLLTEVRNRFDELKRAAGLLTFDDLLIRMDEALSEGSPSREALLSAIRSRWTHALIDEFQDTDPLQYRIFRTAFDDRPLVFVGDPKQAIYSFRGADLYAYLAARLYADDRYVLGTNWRSASGMVHAVNDVFSRPEAPFVIEGVPFEAVEPAGNADREPLEGDDLPPLVWWTISEDKTRSKDAATRTVLNGVVNGVRQILASGATIGGRPVEPSSIAILVRTNRQASDLHHALREAGIPAVVGKSGDVWNSGEVAEIEYLLRAFLRPSDRSSVCTALATALWGKTAAEVFEIRQDEALLESVRSDLARYQRLWRDAGVMRALTQFVEDQSVTGRFLKYTDGERRLTNVRHASELLHQEESRHGRGPDELVQWLRMREAKTNGDRETSELRLESDERAVQIVTMHKSKGLEYDIVIAPFLWTGKAKLNQNESVLVHDGSEIVYDIGSESLPSRQRIAEAERLSEDLRLAYVTMTRAVHRCYVVWAEASNAERSPLAYLIKGHEAGGSGTLSARAAASFETTASEVTTALETMADGSELMIVQPLPKDAPLFDPGAPGRTSFAPREFPPESASKLTAWSVRSYSQLVAGDIHEPAFVPDAVPRKGIFAFAAGRVPGNCLHEIIEEVDLRALRSIGSGDASSVDTLVRRKLRAFGLEDASRHRGGDDYDPHEHVMQLLARLGSAPIPIAGVPLPAIDQQRILREWSFTVPVGAITPRGLADAISTFADEPVKSSYPRRLRHLNQDALDGYLTGVADFAFEHDGRWYVFDWKSTNLGPALADYAPERLADAALDRHYVLQLLIYTLGLHRYLQTRMANYDYEQHVGGAGVVFLRGVDGKTDNGFYVLRPPARLVNALEAMLAPIPA